MSSKNDSDFDSARKWSHDYAHHPPKDKGVNWLWIVVIVVLLLLAAWWWWSSYAPKKDTNAKSECSPIDNLAKGAKSDKDNHMTIDSSGCATK